MRQSSSQGDAVHQTHSHSRVISREDGAPNNAGKLDGASLPCLAGSNSPGGRGRGRGGRTARGRGRYTMQQHTYHSDHCYGGATAPAAYCGSGRLPDAATGPSGNAASMHKVHVKTEQPQDFAHASSLGAQQPYMPRHVAAAPVTAYSSAGHAAAVGGQQQQLGLDLVLSPTGLPLPKLEPTLDAGCTAGVPHSDTWQMPKQRNSNLQLPGTGLFSPSSCPFEMGRMSSLGFERTFSSELAGLQGLQPWIPDQPDASSIGSIQPAMPQISGAVGSFHSQQQSPRAAHAVLQQQIAAGQIRAGAGMGPGIQQYNPTTTTAMVNEQRQTTQLMQQQLPQQPQCAMPPPMFSGAHGLCNQQQPQQVQQHGPRRNLQYCYVAPVISSGYMQASLQQRPHMQAAHPHALLTGAFNQGYGGNPNLGCNDIVPPPPGSINLYPHRPAGSQAAAQPAVLPTYGNRYQASVPPPLALPGSAPGPMAGPHPGRSNHSGGYGVGYNEPCARPTQHMGHNAAGILSELEVIKGPAMQGLVDAHCANQQQRISVSALLDAVPFRISSRRLSQGLDPLSSSHQRLSLYGLGTDVLDIFGDGLDFDNFLSYGGTMGGAEMISGSLADMVAPIAPGSRTTIKVQGEPTGQWQSAAAMAAAAFNSLAAGAGLPAPTAAAPLESTAAAGPVVGQQGSVLTTQANAMLNVQVKGSSTGAAADAVADPTAVDASSGGQYGHKRQRSSAANVIPGLRLELGPTTKRQRVSGLLMELDTPSIRAIAGPLLSPRPQCAAPSDAPGTMSSAVKQQQAHVGLAQHTTQPTAGQPFSTRHKVVLDLRSPASQQLEQVHLQQQQLSRIDNDPDVVKDTGAPPVLVVPPPAFYKQHQLLQQQTADVPAGQSTRPAVCVLNLADEPYVPSASTSAAAPLLSSTLSGPIGNLGLAVNGVGCVAQVTVTKAGSKGFLPAMHEIEKMI